MKNRHRSNDSSRRYHDRVARQYDAMYDDPYWEFHDRLTWAAIKPHLPRDASAKCCDLGCGTGKWGLRLLKSGFPTTFVDHAAAMIEQVRAKLQSNPRAAKATLLVADIVDLTEIESDQFNLILAMGDPLSICHDPAKAARQMNRIAAPGATVIATADNKLAALEYYLQRNDLDGLEKLIRTGKTHWLTPDPREQFELTTFTPADLRRLFEHAGFEVISITGKTILPMRVFKQLLADGAAFDRLIDLEAELTKDPTSAARAGHLQIIARKPRQLAPV
jgi:ubiquinone/menaquinone biosynthesis C-methylase UbiE